MADETILPGIPFSALPELVVLPPDTDIYLPVVDTGETDPAKRNKKIKTALIASASQPDPELGNVFTDTITVEKAGAHDNSHIRLINRDITGKLNNEQRVELILLPDGRWTFRNVTHEPIVFVSGDHVNENVIIQDNGDVYVRGKIFSNNVEVGTPGGTGSSTLAVYDAAKTYAYNATAPELVLHTVDGKLRIFTLKNTPDTNTPQTRLAPSYATNSQWIDVGKDVFESTAQSTIFDEYKAQPGNENKTWADFQAAITGPQGIPGPVGPASTVPGPVGPVGPASTVPGPAGYTPQKNIDYFDGAPGPGAITQWLTLNPGKTLTDYEKAFQGPEGEKGEGALFYRVISVLPTVPETAPADPRDAYIIEDANAVPHIWIWLPGPAEWYDLGASSQVQLPAEPIDPALLDAYFLKAGGDITGQTWIRKGGDFDQGHLYFFNPNITGKKNNEQRVEMTIRNNGEFAQRNVTHEPFIWYSGNFLNKNLILDDAGNLIIRGNAWANGVLLGQPAPPEGVKWLIKPATPTINNLNITVEAGRLDNAGTVVDIPAKMLAYTFSGPNTERWAAITAPITNPSAWVLQNGAAYPVGSEALLPVIPANHAALTYIKITNTTATIDDGKEGITEARVQEIVTEELNGIAAAAHPGFEEEWFSSTPYTTLHPTTLKNIVGAFWNGIKSRRPKTGNSEAPHYSYTALSDGRIRINATPEMTGGEGEIVYVATSGGTNNPDPNPNPTPTLTTLNAPGNFTMTPNGETTINYSWTDTNS